AKDEMDQLIQHYSDNGSPKTHYFSADKHPIVMYPLKDEVIKSVRPALLLLAGAVFMVLLIACVNVANLLLARAESRQREIAMRRALGASYGQLARQFVTEGTLLALLGAGFGLLVAYGSLRLMIITNAGLVPRIAETSLNGRALLFALITCLATGILFGMAPLMHVAGKNLHSPLKTSTRLSTASGPAQMFRRVLVSGEIALALVLLVGSGLMVKGFWKLLQVDPGFSSGGVLTMRLALTPTAYPDDKSSLGFWQRLQDRMAALPGVESAALVTGLPPTRRINANDTMIEGLAPGPDSPVQNVDYYNAVTPEYFQTMKIRLLEGRFLERGDGPDSQPVVVINQAMAHHFYGNQSPIGRRIKSGGNESPWRTIVGVIADVKNAGLDQPAGTELFFPATQTGFGRQNFYVALRTNGDPSPLSRSAGQAIHDLDPTLPISSVRTMDDVLASAESRPRFLTLLLGLFSLLALTLAAVGIYGLMAYSVTQRTQEIGVRMALGARSGNVIGMIVKYGMGLTVIGMGAGVLAAIGLTRLMTTILFSVSATDPLTFVAVPAVLALVSLVACCIPAIRASRVDPIVALRSE
ncbi:MAG TPA: ABC transporter permease, partial [Blastocatellia bacterium]|nr:ABC transporter permease [Blastocatellia bacterium]